MTPQRILITGARAPAALHLARLLGGAGHHVVMADSTRWPVGAASNACQSYVRLPPANEIPDIYGAAVRAALIDHRIDLVIPTCEEVFYLARLWAQGGMPARLFAPSLETLLNAHDKYAFVQLARALGLDVPETWHLKSKDDLAALHLPADQLVFKPVWSRFATHVITKPRKIAVQPTATGPWVAQAFVPGEEVCVYAVAIAGKLVALSAYRPTYRAGRGAGIAFAPDRDPAIATYLRRFIAGTQWDGQISLDLIRRDDGTLSAIECNPRTTSGVHFFHAPKDFARALLDGAPVTPDVQEPMAVKAALALYGPLQRPLGVWRDLASMPDVVAWPGDPRPAWRQFASTLEFALIALRHRIGLTAATTHDIAWNGN